MATILIIDDRAPNREYLVTLLGYGGHRLLQASDGAEGLTIVRAEQPDLVIADILMPTMDGFEFVRRLRADPAIAGTRVMFFTAHYHEREARSLAAECGVAHVLIKPAEPEVVLRTVEEALGETQTPAAPPAEEFEHDHLRLLTDTLARKADALSAANHQLNALIELGLQLGSERDPARLLQTYCVSAREILGARYALVGILDAEGRELLRFFTSGFEPAVWEQLGTPDPTIGALRVILEDRRTLRLTRPADTGEDLQLPESFPAFASFLGAPISSPARVYGWICLFDKVGAPGFSEEDERLAAILAAQVGRIYENGSLYANLLSHSAQMEEEIRERRRVEADLRESEGRFRTLCEAAPISIYQSDAEGLVVYTNARWQALSGLTFEESLGVGWNRADHPEDRDRVLREWLEAVRLGREFRTVCRILPPSGELRWVNGRAAPILAADGRFSGHVGTVEDFTERKELEDRYRQAQQRLEHVVTSSPAVLFTLVPQGSRFPITWISGNIRDLLGYEPDEVYSPDWWRARVHPDDLDRVMLQLTDPLLREGSVTDEYRFRARSGQYRWMRSDLRLLRDAAGEPVEVVGSWTDITERKLLEDQFRQAQKMEAIGRLAGGIAHDFNNMLAVINGYGEMLLGHFPEGDPHWDMVTGIVEAGNRAAALTRQLLVFSRKAMVEPRILDLRGVVTDMDRMLRRIIGEDIQLTTVADPQLGRVRADLSHVEQVVLNLAVNARDAMPTGGRLTLELRNVVLDESYAREHAGSRAGRHVMLAVSDTGCGMDAATLSRIFEPFFTTKGNLGTGLGLATVYGIVQQAGGHVGVYSEVGVGTAFKLYLPRVNDPPESTPAPGPGSMPQGTETILLAEDDDAVRGLTGLILRQRGYTVLAAGSGAEALRLAEAHRAEISLLITDVVMPQMSGRTLAAQLMDLQPGLKVLFLSGYTEDAVVRHGVLQAEVAFLQKPFSPGALLRKVREVLEEGREG